MRKFKLKVKVHQVEVFSFIPGSTVSGSPQFRCMKNVQKEPSIESTRHCKSIKVTGLNDYQH
jgi:hypothetical protein